MSVAAAEPSPPLPTLRLLPAPATEPPYDDEPGAETVHRPDNAALSLVPVSRARPGRRPPTADPPWCDGLPDPRAVTHALVQRLLEAMAGVRPVAQLKHDTSPELFERLQRLSATQGRAQGSRPSSRSVRSVHTQPVADGVVEACATVVRGSRAGAVALRLEARSGRWCCTELVGA